MRKVSLIALLLGFIIWVPINPVLAQDDADLSLVFMGAGMVDDDFERLTGGLAMGAIKSVDSDQNMFVRFTYSQFNLTPGEPIQSIKPALLWKFNLGHKWHFWLVPAGADVYLSGENNNVDMFVGAGAQRRIWTLDDGNGFNAFGEISFTDADPQQYGNFLQFNFGLIFDYPKK